MIAYKASLVASCKSQVLFSLAIDESRLLNREENVQVSDTTKLIVALQSVNKKFLLIQNSSISIDIFFYHHINAEFV